MDPKLIRKDIKYQKKTLIMVSVLVVCLFIGGSFALLSSSSETEEVVTFKTGDLNMEVAVTGTLSLEGELPKSYEDGFKSNDITITLTNIGSLEIGKYEVKLEGDTGTTLENSYIRYSVSDDDGKTYLASKLLSDTNNIIYTGYSLKTSKVLKLKVWIDEGAGSNALKKIYNGNINVELYQNEDTLVDVVKSKLVSNYSGVNESFEGGLVGVNTNGDLYHEGKSETIREYRYSGPSVNNYVTFNDEEWRIVGVFKDENNQEHIKIVRNNILAKAIFPIEYKIGETIYNIQALRDGNYAYWNKKASGTNENNDWATAGLQYFLNTEEDETEGETNKGYLSTLKGDTLDMIEDSKYYLGAVKEDPVKFEGIDDIPKEAYANERDVESCVNNIGTSVNQIGCKVWENNQATWKGKVALLYPSDYGYSGSNANWKIQLKNFYTVKTSSWLDSANLSSEWFLSPCNNSAHVVASLYSNGKVNNNSIKELSLSSGVRPTLYLKSNVKITSGEGTSTDPYKLILE